MYAVIFRSKINQLDAGYSVMAEQLRKKALSYGCLEFSSVQEGNEEIAISYWQDLEAIDAWKQDTLHRRAQKRGQSQWYSDYHVEVVEVLRAYRKAGGHNE